MMGIPSFFNYLGRKLGLLKKKVYLLKNLLLKSNSSNLI